MDLDTRARPTFPVLCLLRFMKESFHITFRLPTPTSMGCKVASMGMGSITRPPISHLDVLAIPSH